MTSLENQLGGSWRRHVMWWGSSPTCLTAAASRQFASIPALVRLAGKNSRWCTETPTAQGFEMTSEPTEEAIANFVSFTSASRELAVSFLKVSKTRSLRISLAS